MRSKNSLLFVKTFMLSILISVPFLTKQMLFCKEKKSMADDLVGVEDFTMSESNISNEQKDSNSNEESNKNTNTNTNSNSNSTFNIIDENSSSASNDSTKPTYIVNSSFVKVDDNYFEDALFIGDSRTVGIKEYGKLTKATYFCDTGMSIYNLDSKKLSVSGVGKVTLKELLEKKKYGKIYIMLGINEIGYNIDKSATKFKETVESIKKAQPDAIIFIQANLHVSKEKSERDSTFSNKRIDKYNNKLAAIADNKTIFYFDANEIFDDGAGNLKASYTFDNTHIYAKYYVNWTDFIKEHGIEVIKDENLLIENESNEEQEKVEDASNDIETEEN